MEQLTGFDQSFLNLETPAVRGHVAGLVVLDPDTAPESFGLDSVRRVIEQRIHLLPPFRRRLVEVPLGLDHSYWVEDPHFDLDYHLRHFAVPAPGDEAQLATLVASLHERPLDRTRPLWELYLIEGLEGGRVAVYTKLHHAAVDGLSGAEILTILLDAEPDGRQVPTAMQPWRPESLPSEWSLIARSGVAMLSQPKRALKLGYTLLKLAPGLSSRVLGGPSPNGEETGTRLRAPNTILNRQLSPHRRFAYGKIGLDRIKRVKNAYQVSVNDVVVALASGAIRRWLTDHGGVPPNPLQALIPLSTRTPETSKEIRNQVTTAIIAIGTHLAQSKDRLRFAHQAMNVVKAQHRAVPATLLQDFAQFTPPAVAAQATRLVSRRGIVDRVTAANVVISNVPGPPFPLFLAGARLEAHFPVSTIAAGVGLNITLIRYLDDLCFGLVADRDVVPDLWLILRYLQEEVDALERAAPTPCR